MVRIAGGRAIVNERGHGPRIHRPGRRPGARPRTLGRATTPVRLYELLREPGYALFVFASAMRLRTDRESLAALIRSVGEGYGEAVRPYVVLDEGVSEAADARALTLIDVKGQLRNKLGAEHGSVLLVRPDGYLAFHRKGFDPQALSAALAPWVCRHSPVRDPTPALAGGH